MFGIQTWPVGASRSDGLSRRAFAAVASPRELTWLESWVLCAGAASSEANLRVADRCTRLWALPRDKEPVCRSVNSSCCAGLVAGSRCSHVLPWWSAGCTDAPAPTRGIRRFAVRCRGSCSSDTQWKATCWTTAVCWPGVGSHSTGVQLLSLLSRRWGCDCRIPA